MKKSLLFIAVLSAFSFASCKKDRVCTCTTTNTTTSTEPGYTNTSSSTTDITTYIKAKKGDARVACSSYTFTNSEPYDYTVITYDSFGNPTGFTTAEATMTSVQTADCKLN